MNPSFNKFLKRSIKWCRRYISLTLITIVAFVIFILFFNENSIMQGFEYNDKIDELKAKIQENTDTLNYYNNMLQQLNHNPEAMEKVVREHYHMQHANEDVYVFALEAILAYFKRLRLIGSYNLRHQVPAVSVLLYTDAFDIFNRGGFYAQEELLQKEVQKLLLEIERLKPTLGDEIEKISTIGNNIAGIAGALFGGFISATKSL